MTPSLKISRFKLDPACNLLKQTVRALRACIPGNRMIGRLLEIVLVLIAFSLFSPMNGVAENRFPQPQFGNEYSVPTIDSPEPTGITNDFIDLALLFLALAVATYLIHKRRSRKAVFVFMLVCLAYFGFWRKGCICPIGSIQNVTGAVSGTGYTISFAVLGFFLLPIVSALFSGRIFCSSVCPLGAIQDVVILKPVKLPWQISRTLRVIPYAYLGLAVLLAWTGSAYIICRLDPFVSFFRLSGSMGMILLGTSFLLIGIFVARPYCRFLCPYGIILGWASSFSKKSIRISPDKCIECRLCEESCPFDAIRKPVPTEMPEAYGKAKKRLLLMLALVPVITILSGWLGSLLYGPISRLDNTVILAERIHAEDAGNAKGTTLRSEAFRRTGEETAEIYARAQNIRDRIKTGSWLLGGFVGFVIGCGLVKYSTRRTRTEYEVDRMECLSCGRCLAYCPVEKPQNERNRDTHL